MSETRILGIDCGTAITGWSILSIDLSAKTAKLIDCGIVQTHKLTPEEFRLQDLGDSIQQIITEYKPNQLAIEDIFFFKNAKTVIKVSQARGVVIYQAVSNGLSYHSYTPLQIKQRITGYGKADKKQMMFMVNSILKLKAEITQDDAADAVAVAYCHFLSL
jgi:crossover junction endodeoxyribonuclease RuvC